MLKDKIILINLVIMAGLLSTIVYLVIASVFGSVNSSVGDSSNETVHHTTMSVKSDSRASVELTAGYDRRVQWTMPAYSLNMAVFDDYKLGVR